MGKSQMTKIDTPLSNRVAIRWPLIAGAVLLAFKRLGAR
jgi:hypothetical protein